MKYPKLAVFLVACSIGLGAAAADPAGEPGSSGSVSGRVVSNTDKPAVDATVTLVELHRRVRTDAEGGFRFDDVPPGVHLVQAVSPRYGSVLATVSVTAGEQVELPMRLDLAVHAEHVTVTAGLRPRGLSDIAQAADVLSGTELASRIEPTLGETLSKQPGISSTYFGPGASRPVIRGLGGDRIRILEDGIGTGDASSVSPDHAVATDPVGAERIEIVRGPATLLYGSNAVGGVVNILDARIPDHRIDEPIGGTLDLSAGTVSDERRGAVSLTGGLKSLGWNVNYLDRSGDDHDTPIGTLKNTAIETDQGGAGLSWSGDSGYIGLAFQRLDTLYGVPGDEPIKIDMEQTRYDLRGDVHLEQGFFRTLSLRTGHTDYEHVELEETGDPGTRFLNDYWEARLEGSHRRLGPLAGTIGFQISTRDLQAIGEEAIVPPTTTEQRAVFLFEELGPESLRFSFGARYENQEVGVADPTLRDRSFDALSGSAGLVWKLQDKYAVAVSLARTSRGPVAEELYVNGAHPATAQFEVGDPNLGRETTLGLDLGLRKLAGRVSGEISVFGYDFGDYIFLRPTGVVDLDSGFEIFEFRHDDARFRGAEAHVDIEIVHAEPHHLQLELGADTVRAELRTNDEPLPFIPPARGSIALSYRGPKLWSRLEARHSNTQDRVSAFETPTPGFTLLDATAGYRFFGHPQIHDVIVRVSNFTDRLVRNHVSPLKDVAPLPGRDVRLTYRLTF